jgi:hypothetical protein
MINVTEFESCDRLNGTYLDCPISKKVSASEWVLSVFNPRMKTQEVFNIKLPHAYWIVLGWN